MRSKTKISDDLVAPNHPGMPHWPVYSTAAMPTMIFDNRSRVENGPDAKEQRSVAVT
jgi:carboxylesterase type B